MVVLFEPGWGPWTRHWCRRKRSTEYEGNERQLNVEAPVFIEVQVMLHRGARKC